MTTQEQKLTRMKALIQQLNDASEAYYGTNVEKMSNLEFDTLYDELTALEQELGIILANSPTQNVGYEVVSSLPKETHTIPALSLEKTKDLSTLQDFLGEQEGLLSWKLDGLTVVLTYENGTLVKALTRGNGVIGEVITPNAKCFEQVPLQISYPGSLTVRGEALITYDDFQKINASLPEGEEPYKNPRNLCSGSVRQLDSRKTKERHVKFFAFAMQAPEATLATRNDQLNFLDYLGFTAVEHIPVTRDTLEPTLRQFETRIQSNPFPSDGLVLQYNNVAYGESLGTTAKVPKDSLAFKWKDEKKDTILREIHWSPSRTGLITPVAIFDPVELEGTTVRRASIHNLGILEQLSLTPGDTISVYKANMIIPQIAENKTRQGTPTIPTHCPICGGPVRIEQTDDAKRLWCSNPECSVKQIQSFVHFTSRDALNMEGISKETLRCFLDEGFLTSLADLFRLSRYRSEIIALEGFGEKSYQKVSDAIRQARHTTLQRLLYSLGIDMVGRTATKRICQHFNYDVSKTINATMEQLLEIPDIGQAIAKSFVTWFANPLHQELFEDLLQQVILEVPNVQTNTTLTGQTFVITGSLEHFQNRDALKQQIESLGGKVTGSVSKNTTYLINNDFQSTSGKNKKAKDLNIPIITEETFLSMIETA